MYMAKNKYSSINFNHVYEKNSTPANSNANNPAKNNPAHPSAPSYSAASYSSVSSPNKSHGRMLVLTRPNPKPVSIPSPSSPHLQQQQPPNLPLQQQKASANLPLKQQQQPSINPILPQQQQHANLILQQQQQSLPDQPRVDVGSEVISLRPLGQTGAGSLLPIPVLNHDKDTDLMSPAITSPKPDKFVPPHLRPGFVGREDKPGPEHCRIRDSGRRNTGRSAGFPDICGENGRPTSGLDRTRRVVYSDVGTIGRPGSSGGRPS